MRNVNDIINALPAEDKKRLEKMAEFTKKSIEELAVFLLREGVSTHLASVLHSSSSTFIF